MSKIMRYIYLYKPVLIVMTVIVFVDTFTKILIFNLLKLETIYPIYGKDVCLFVVLNKTYTSSIVFSLLESISDKGNNSFYLFLTAFSDFVLAAYLIKIKKEKIKYRNKIILYFAILLSCSIILNLVASILPRIYLSSHFISWFTKVGSLSLTGTYFYFSTNRIPKYIWAIMFSAGFANLINHFYPPYYIIDYLYVEKLNEYLKMGVFNVADVIINLGAASMITYFIVLLIKKILLKINIKKTLVHP